MKIFFFGGTFDPPHNGHQTIVNYCLEKCDKLILVPNKKSPHKKFHPSASTKQRKKMLSILFAHNKINICEFELKSAIDNYTYLTIDYLKKKYKSSDLTMILGNDQLLNLKNWKNVNYILSEVKILCFNRSVSKNIELSKSLKYNLKFVENFKVNISSNMIRKNILNKSLASIEPMLDKKIIDYIKEKKLYV